MDYAVMLKLLNLYIIGKITLYIIKILLKLIIDRYTLGSKYYRIIYSFILKKLKAFALQVI